MSYASDVAFTESVKRIQRERGSRKSYERLEQQRGGFASTLSSEVAAYIAERESAYFATANTAGQPYVQHRGGPPGFIKVLDPQTLAFADFGGNRQYITTGNLTDNDRAFLFLMNYAAGERIKIWGRARVVTDDQQLFARLIDPHYDARVEQAIVFTVTAWDANCSQHIPNFIRGEPAERALEVLRRRIRYLEATLNDAQVAFVPEDEFSKD
jgi:predicted pyridoxine 5'-phosphate oxidase superfamily flavin-nucleotide-binding protein